MKEEKLSSLQDFQNRLHDFYQEIASFSLPLAIEIRNQNYLCKPYFGYLKKHGITNVFNQRRNMPPNFKVYERYKSFVQRSAVICLIGKNRKQIEKISGELWNKIWINRDEELKEIARMQKISNIRGKGFYATGPPKLRS